MFSLKHPLLWLPGWMLACGSVYAELKWDTQKVELTPRATDAYADAKFGFVNTGETAVTIESVKSSCGCTVPTLEKKTYAAGERGELLAHFLIGDRRGVQTKTIRVQVQGERDPAVLTLVVNIPELLRVIPPVLVWEQGEAAEAKTFSLQAQTAEPVRVQKVTSTNSNMTFKVETVTEAKDYQLAVTPKNTDKPGMALVTIEAIVMGKPKTFSAYLQIKPKLR